ncbi:MAG: hypothetical protein IPI82_10015 [Candidatus Microthrix sp.]|nr:hypothetical protein [Candidatus Microthrix sp.]MBK7322757.1 hypothetical protein [Candidatus Microthrix sp.]
MEDESALAPKRVAVPGRVLWVVLAIWMVALGFRVAYITQINPDQPLTGDGGYYHALGNSLPKEGFRRAFEFSMVTEETAAHPPGYPVLLSLGSRIGLTTPDDHRMLTALVGSLAVPLLALSAARLAGRRRRGPPPSARMVGWAAIGAAVIATVNVNMWSWDALILAEPLVMTATSLWLYALLVYDDRPGPGAVLTAGLALGVAAATRSELILAGVVILVLLWRHRSLPWQRLALHSAAFGAGALMVLGPWLWSNMHRFEEPVLMTTGVGTTMLQGNCDSAFYGPLTGYSDYSCFDRSRSLMNLDMDASERDLVARNIAGDYIQTHRARLPVVAAARIAPHVRLFSAGTAELLHRGPGAARPALGGVGWAHLVAVAVATWYRRRGAGPPGRSIDCPRDPGGGLRRGRREPHPGGGSLPDGARTADDRVCRLGCRPLPGSGRPIHSRNGRHRPRSLVAEVVADPGAARRGAP